MPRSGVHAWVYGHAHLESCQTYILDHKNSFEVSGEMTPQSRRGWLSFMTSGLCCKWIECRRASDTWKFERAERAPFPDSDCNHSTTHVTHIGLADFVALLILD